MPEHISLLARALATLRDRPVLFQFVMVTGFLVYPYIHSCLFYLLMFSSPSRYCLSELITARRNAISRAFIEALTRGGPGGMPKPIELFSHDALRYTRHVLVSLAYF